MTERREIECPGCGKKTIVAVSEDTKKMDFECPQCKTGFTLTFKTDEEDNLRHYILAEDIKD